MPSLAPNPPPPIPLSVLQAPLFLSALDGALPNVTHFFVPEEGLVLVKQTRSPSPVPTLAPTPAPSPAPTTPPPTHTRMPSPAPTFTAYPTPQPSLEPYSELLADRMVVGAAAAALALCLAGLVCLLWFRLAQQMSRRPPPDADEEMARTEAAKVVVVSALTQRRVLEHREAVGAALAGVGLTFKQLAAIGVYTDEQIAAVTDGDLKYMLGLRSHEIRRLRAAMPVYQGTQL